MLPNPFVDTLKRVSMPNRPNEYLFLFIYLYQPFLRHINILTAQGHVYADFVIELTCMLTKAFEIILWKFD